MPSVSTPSIAILGAGVSGLGMAIELVRAGVRSFTIFEKSERLGGTWRDNTYPGAACDIPSHLYSFSNELNPGWSRRFSNQAEILAYLERCADKYGLRAHIRFGAELERARFDEQTGQWQLRMVGGDEASARVLITACGQLSRPRIARLPGLDAFGGKVFHSARWDHDFDLRDKEVAVIGTGASAIQFIPRIAPMVRKLHVFQRSANWVVPRRDHAYGPLAQWAFERAPHVARLHRYGIYALLEAHFFGFTPNSLVGRYVAWVAKRHLFNQVSDPALRQRLLPDYPIGCKRVLISDDFLPALTRPNVEVVTEPIDHFGTESVFTKDGRERRLDAAIFATGFDTTSFLAPMRIQGLGGTCLDEAWSTGAEAHLGLTVSGFPNLFMLYGPNTNLGHNSIIFMIECQAQYIRRCIDELSRRDLAYLEVKREAMSRFNAELQRDLAKSVWATGCTSWYKTETGKVTNNWSGFTLDYWRRTRRPDMDDFVLHPRA